MAADVIAPQTAIETNTNVKIPRDLVRMAATIAAHRRVTIAEILDPIIRAPLTALFAEVGEEMQAAAKAGAK